jgi:hypothetical protein
MRLRLIAPLAMAAAASALGIVPVAGAAPINYDSQNPFFGPFGNILIFHHRGAHR